MTKKVCPDPPRNLLTRCLETIPRDTTQVLMRPRLSLELPSRTRLRWLALAAAIPAITVLAIVPIHKYFAVRSVETVTAKPESDIASLKFTKVYCKQANLDIDGGDNHGRLQVVFTDGTKQDIAGELVCQKNSADANPQIASDHRTSGWLNGEHLFWNTSHHFLPTRLIIYRHNHILRSIEGERGFMEAFSFVNGGKQVAYRTRGYHGVAVIALYDLDRGKIITKYDESKVNSTYPSWAQKLVLK